MASDVSTTDSDVRNVFALEEKGVADSGPDIEMSCVVPLVQDEVAILGASDYSTAVASWLLFLGMNVRMYNTDGCNAKLVRSIQNEVVTCHELFRAIKSRLQDVQGPQFTSGAYEQGKLLVSQLLEDVMHPNVVAIMDCMARDNELLYHQCRAYVPNVVVLISADVPPAVQLDFMYMVRFIEPVRFIRPVVVEPKTPKSVLTLLRRLMLFPTSNPPPINILEAQENCFKAIGRRPLRHVWAPHCMECHGAKTLVMNQNCVHVWLCKDCCAFRTDPCPTCGAAFSPFLWRQMLGETAYEVSVCGAGYLGMKITAWLMWLGVDVRVHDIYKPREDVARELQHELENIDNIFYELGMKCGQGAGDLNNRYLRPMGRFLGASSALEDCLGVRTFLVIDAVIDDVLVKGDFFHRCHQLSPHAILTTNSMQLSLENISQQAQLKESKVFRLRFLEPVYFIPFVETSQEDPRVDDPPLKSLLGFLEWCNSMPFSGSYRLKLFPSVVDSTQLIQLSALMQRKPMKNMFMRTETCIVCWSRPPVVLNIGGCTHICLCRDCVPRMVASSLVDSQCRAQVCPLCRAPLRPVAETPSVASTAYASRDTHKNMYRPT